MTYNHLKLARLPIPPSAHSVVADEESQETGAVSSAVAQVDKFQGSDVTQANRTPATGTKYAERPDFEAPRRRRQAGAWAQCLHCKLWFASDAHKVESGMRKYCSHPCAARHFAAIGKFKRENNPNWLGGVSDDNMRYRRRQMEREPEKEAARRAAQYEIRVGRIVRRPCEKCGAEKAEAHHDDYTKPLVVRWLCRTHHVEHHSSQTPCDRETDDE